MENFVEMKLNELIDEVKLTLKWDESDIEYDDRIITRFINSQRSLSIKNEINKGNLLSNTVYQTINSIPLILVSGAMVPSYISNDKFLTSKQTLPRIMEIKNELQIKSVRLPELSGKELNLVAPKEISFVGNGKFNGAEMYCSFYRDRIFIKNSNVNRGIQNLNDFTLDAIFEDPTKLVNVINSDGTKAYDLYKDHYPINDNLWEYMIGAIRKNRYTLLMQLKEAEANNDTDNS